MTIRLGRSQMSSFTERFTVAPKLVSLVLLLLVGCSSGSSPSGSGNADATDTSATTPTSDATTSSGDATSGPRRQLSVSPPDLTTNAAELPLWIVVEQLTSSLVPELLETLSGDRVALYDLGGRGVPFTLGSVSPRIVEVVPAKPLEDAWYEVVIDLRGLKFDASPTLVSVADGKFASWFRIGSAPVLRTIRFCQGKVEVEFSESLIPPSTREANWPLRVFADSEECDPLPLDEAGQQVQVFQFACAADKLDLLDVVQSGELTTGAVTASLVWDEPDAKRVSFDVRDSYMYDNCTCWRP